MPAMRRIAIGLALLATACATDRGATEVADDTFVQHADLAGGGSVTDVSHEQAWQAACRAMAWGGGLVRVDSKTRTVGCGDALEVKLVPYPNGNTGYSVLADTTRGGDVAWEAFLFRFHLALDLLRRASRSLSIPRRFPRTG